MPDPHQQIIGNLCGCILQVIMPEAPEWETAYLTWQAELQNKSAKELPEEFTAEKVVIEQDGGEGGLHRWQPAPRETEADAANDTQSLRRKLDQRLFLLIKGKGKLPTLFMCTSLLPFTAWA